VLSSAVCAAHERVRDPTRGERSITRDDLYGWLNSNGAGDFNKLHDHGGADSWSGVYYIQCPKPSAATRPTGSDASDDSESDDDAGGEEYGVGALGLRCHAAAPATSSTAPAVSPAAAAVSSARGGGGGPVRYLRFNPAGGDLVLFRGDVLHAVESNGWARGGHTGEAADMDMDRQRLSFAFNEDSLDNDRKLVAKAVAAAGGSGEAGGGWGGREADGGGGWRDGGVTTTKSTSVAK